LVLDDSNQKKFASLDAERISLLVYLELIYGPRDGHLLLGADITLWTPGAYNLADFVVSLVQYMLYNRFTAAISHFNTKETRYLSNDKVSEISVNQNEKQNR
jgi:hypothetical protein